MKPCVLNFQKLSSLQRSSFILDFYAPFSLYDAPVLDYFQTPRPIPTLPESSESQNAPEILGQEYEVGTVHELKPTSKPLSVLVE